MTTETSKGADIEIPVFRAFVARSGLPVDPLSVQKRLPPEPDILCRMLNGETVAFELVEICDPNIPENRETGADMATADPSLRIVGKKLGKWYDTASPVELLCYTHGRVSSPDSYIAAQVIPLIAETVSQYRRVWLFGRTGVQVLWERSDDAV